MKIFIINLAIIILITLILSIVSYKNRSKLIIYIVYLMIVLPVELFIDLPGSLPTLTSYRTIMFLLILSTLIRNPITFSTSNVPASSLIFIILLFKIIALINAVDIPTVFNEILIFTVEFLAFYLIVMNSVTNTRILNGMMLSITFATLTISIIGFVDYYTLFNPVDYIALPGLTRLDPDRANEVFATFPHPILFGTSLAMGWPFCILIFERLKGVQKLLLGLFISTLFAGLYFSHSRGPWIGFIISLLILILLGYSKIKLKIVFLTISVLLLFLSRPGVYDTIFGLISVTTNPDHPEGTSFLYRLELYRKAFSEIKISFSTFLFGYGDGAHRAMDLSGPLSFDPTWYDSFWSWDSQFAIILLEGGVLGFLLYLALFSYIILFLLNKIRKVNYVNKDIIIASMASISVYFFMMTNVALFAPQLNFLFLSSVIIGIKAYQLDENSELFDH